MIELHSKPLHSNHSVQISSFSSPPLPTVETDERFISSAVYVTAVTEVNVQVNGLPVSDYRPITNRQNEIPPEIDKLLHEIRTGFVRVSPTSSELLMKICEKFFRTLWFVKRSFALWIQTLNGGDRTFLSILGFSAEKSNDLDFSISSSQLAAALWIQSLKLNSEPQWITVRISSFRSNFVSSLKFLVGYCLLWSFQSLIFPASRFFSQR